MQARITALFVAVLAVALSLAGALSLYLVRHAASQQAQRTVLRQAQAIARSTKTAKLTISTPVLELIKSVAGFNQAAVLVISKNELASPSLPGIAKSSIDARKLAEGQSISGSSHHIAFAVAPLFSIGGKNSETVAIGFESAESFTPFWYFIVGGGLSLIVVGGLAAIISKTMSRRVVAASHAAQQIAKGDFTVRVGRSVHDYPEVSDLSMAINTMAEDLGRARQLEREFLLSVSHELRTPLTSIRGYGEAIIEGATNDPVAAAAVVVSETGRLERLIGDLLDLARLRAGQFALELGLVDLSRRVQQAGNALLYEFEECGVALSVRVPDEPVLVQGDPDRIGQILANLLENALKFAARAVEIALVTEQGPAARISVSDDGPGIHEDDRTHVFERLFTSSRHTARSVGSGLGLTIVNELSRAMGGKVEVHSLRDEGPEQAGTRIDIVFPASPGSEAKGPTVLVKETPTSASSNPSR